MHCASCGNLIPDNSEFCNSCGQPVGRAPKGQFQYSSEQQYVSKKLYRSRNDRVFAGICGGLGIYFKMDPILIRLIWVLFTLAGGAGILAYLIMYIVIPEEPY